jgi:hypothetical protein
VDATQQAHTPQAEPVASMRRSFPRSFCGNERGGAIARDDRVKNLTAADTAPSAKLNERVAKVLEQVLDHHAVASGAVHGKSPLGVNRYGELSQPKTAEPVALSGKSLTSVSGLLADRCRMQDDKLHGPRQHNALFS